MAAIDDGSLAKAQLASDLQNASGNWGDNRPVTRSRDEDEVWFDPEEDEVDDAGNFLTGRRKRDRASRTTNAALPKDCVQVMKGWCVLFLCCAFELNSPF